MPVSLQDQVVQICPFRVKLYTKLAAGMLEPVCNDGTIIAMMTPFNRHKLDTMAYLDSQGEGMMPALNCRMDTPFFGPNIRFCVCMDGATKVVPGVIPKDNLSTPTVIYGNCATSLAELMYENAAPRKKPLMLWATSSDEKASTFVVQLTPLATAKHYSAANARHIASIAAKHIDSTVIARALYNCQQTRRAELISVMEQRGVAAINSSTFCMTLPVGSLFDLSTGEADECTLDATQWHALVQKTSAMLAEAHTFKLCEAMVLLLTHSMAPMGVDIMQPAAVRGFLIACNSSAAGQNWLKTEAQKSLRTANECSFLYTSDSEIKGFAVRNRESGVFLEAQIDSSGEKQNLFGMDPIVSDLHLQRKCEILRERTVAQLEEDLLNTEPAGHAALHAASDIVLTNIMMKQDMSTFAADCEDASACLAGMAHTAAHMDPEHLAACVHRVMDSAAFCASAQNLKEAVLATLPHVREPMRSMQIGLVFAHAASFAEMRVPVVAAELPGVKAKYYHMVDNVNAHLLTGHAVCCDVKLSEHATPIHKLFCTREVLAVQPLEGTNPIDVVDTDWRCMLNTKSSLPKLNEQLQTINGEMPWTSANSIVSEITSKSASNITGCNSSAVTSTTANSTFYHTMISLGSGYVYSTDATVPMPGLTPITLPTANMAVMGKDSTRVFTVEGCLLDSVTIADTVYTESQLLDIVVGAASCLAPSLEHIISMRSKANFKVLGGCPPPLSARMARVVLRGRILPLTDTMTETDHLAEVRAREQAARRVHPGALSVSLTSGTWNMYVPQG